MFRYVCAVLLLTAVSCGRNDSQREGVRDAGEANGDIYGTDAPTDNQNTQNRAATTDTVRGTTTNGNTSGRSGATGTNDANDINN